MEGRRPPAPEQQIVALMPEMQMKKEFLMAKVRIDDIRVQDAEMEVREAHFASPHS